MRCESGRCCPEDRRGGPEEPQTAQKSRRMHATDLLAEIQPVLRCESLKLLNLPQDSVIMAVVLDCCHCRYRSHSMLQTN
jgi:hypothetical protein